MFPRNLEYIASKNLESRQWKTKHRVYGEQRRFLGNYETVLGKEGALQKVTDKDFEGCLVSGPFAEADLKAKYPKVLLNSLGVPKISQSRTSELWSAKLKGAPPKRLVYRCSRQDRVFRTH